MAEKGRKEIKGDRKEALISFKNIFPPKIGIFGGLFDPPHIGHLIIAQWVLEEFNLNKIIFVPAFNPPHKSNYSPFKHRYEMTKMAIKGNRSFLISDIESKIKEKTYTIDMIRKLKKNDRKLRTSKLYLIVGADQWEQIESWREAKEIFKECKVIVVQRPNYKIKRSIPYYKKVLISNSPLIGLSSSTIRKKVKSGFSIRYLVVPDVLNYINKFKLYALINYNK